jgi:3-methylfumaryl-CoA hydratase
MDGPTAAPVDLRTWIGRVKSVADVVGAAPIAALTATLDHPARTVHAGTPLPPLWA